MLPELPPELNCHGTMRPPLPASRAERRVLRWLLAAAPAALLQARYSRGMESEADTWGAAMLRENGMSPGLLASILERLESAHRGKGIDVPEYLNSHPETEARIRALRGAS